MFNAKEIYAQQERFEYHFLGVIFTLLALALGSGDPAPMQWQANFEILGRFSLLAAGLFGLSRLEWVPSIYKALLMKEERADLEFQQALAEKLLILERKTKWKYRFMKWLFAWGVLALAVARSASLLDAAFKAYFCPI